ncbi:protein MALE DISCOVERER 1-like [Andrographis paniculata]|uniref:protein MALE DISCOVERER 1-like n=1 Tax=Andrographis paniculata TaxID=175694 RepID=UPI0021E84919|nr:protein MALE DISCOVERER 1-like [Andrographis paniculata]
MVRPAMSLKWTNGGRLPCFVFLVLFLGVQRCWCLNSEGLALLHFLAKVASDPSGALRNWDANDNTPCSWRGVRCLHGKVHTLDLSGLGLVGVLAPDLGHLSDLRVLDLSKNDFSGTIPREFGQLTALEILDLRDNNLTGKLPVELGQLHSLKRFDGSIPVLSDNVPKTAADGIAGLNRKFGIRQSFLKQHMTTSDSFGRFKFGDKFSHDHGDSRIDPTALTDSSHAENVNSEFTNLRRRLAEGPSNFVAVPPNNMPQAQPQPDPVLTLPSSGSFPAIPKPKAASPASPPQPASATPTSPGAASQAAVKQSPAGGKSENSSKSIAWTLLIAFVLVIAIVVFIICRSRAAKKLGPWKSGLSGQLQKALVTGVPKLNREELETACEDFSNIIDIVDSVAMVYKGTLSSGVEIAVVSTTVQSLKEWSKRSDLIFRKKIDTLSRVNHKNFLNLIGYCEEDQPFTRMMVFEYAPSGTLYEHLHVKDAEHLDWNARMRIVMGAAYCLQHMHELNPPIPHFLLTSREIFLTDDYAVKIGDMSFWGELVDKSKKPSENESELPLPADLETNVRSFGIMLLEIITGKLPYTKEQGHITNWAAPYLCDEKSMKNLVDPTLSSCNEKQLQVVCDVIKSCVQENERERPYMKEVIDRLVQAINISPDAATPRLSPLWWAELEILSAEAP